jgi:hypothetical protein
MQLRTLLEFSSGPKECCQVDRPKDWGHCCQKCREWMDWRTNGQIQKRRNGRYTYQGCCKGDCQREQIAAKVTIPFISANIRNDVSPPIASNVSHLLQLVEIQRRILALFLLALILTV